MTKPIDYLKEVETILKDLIFVDGMEESEINQEVTYFLKMTNKSLEQLAEELKMGVDNGYSIAVQKKIIKSYFGGKI